MAADVATSLTAKPWRTFAMMAGIMLAAASATAAIVTADTQQTQIDRRFDLQRSAAVVIQAQSAPDGFDEAGLAAVAALQPVTGAGELSVWAEAAPVSLNRWADDQTAPMLVADVGGLSVAAIATGMDPANLASGQPLVWVGETLAARLGLADLRSAQTILVEHRPLSVAGIVRARPGFDYINTSLVVGRHTGVALVPAGRTVRVIVGVRPGSAAAVADYALAALDPTKTLGLVDVTPPDGKILLGGVTTDLKLIGLALGGFVGLIGAIMVANTMSMSVVQRTRELGLRSAMGWTPARIRRLILLESGAAGLFAAVVGCSVGLALALAWAAINAWQPIVSRSLPAIVVLTGTAAAIVGGILPAHRASHVSPLDAMRS